MFVLDFAPQHFEIDAEVAELAQFWYRLAPTGRWDQIRVPGPGAWVHRSSGGYPTSDRAAGLCTKTELYHFFD